MCAAVCERLDSSTVLTTGIKLNKIEIRIKCINPEQVQKRISSSTFYQLHDLRVWQ